MRALTSTGRAGGLDFFDGGRSKVLPPSSSPRSFGVEATAHEGEPLQNPTRLRARIVPPNPITVAIDDENGLPLGYGVVANVSDAGGCVWTDSTWSPARG